MKPANEVCAAETEAFDAAAGGVPVVEQLARACRCRSGPVTPTVSCCVADVPVPSTSTLRSTSVELIGVFPIVTFGAVL